MAEPHARLLPEPDAVGYVASVLVFSAFCMKDMIPLRLVAVCSNVAFLTYGLGLDLSFPYGCCARSYCR
jgi:hypothetical protein